jgi:hypothetical protein
MLFFPAARRTLADCPDPRKLFYYHELKLSRKLSLIYRDAESVAVYDGKGLIVDVDQLPQTVHAGCAVLANIVLNLSVFFVCYPPLL